VHKIIIEIRDRIAVGSKYLKGNRDALELLKKLSVQAIDLEQSNKEYRKQIDELKQIIEMHEGVAHG